MNLGFKDQFVPFVEEGSKRHTIRAGSRWKAGIRADLFARPRQKGMRLLFRAWVTRVETIRIEDGNGYLKVYINGERLEISEARLLFLRDGFRAPGSSMTQAAEFWRERLKPGPFEGQLIHWDYEYRFQDKRKVGLPHLIQMAESFSSTMKSLTAVAEFD